MAFNPGKERNMMAALKRTMEAAWFGTDVSNRAQPPAILNGEFLTAVNNANNGVVPMIGVDSSNRVVIATMGPTLMTITNDASAGGVLLAASKIVNGIYSHAPTAAANDQIDTAANLVGAIPGAVPGSWFEFYLRNTSAGANTITLTGNTGVTLVGTMTIPQNNYRFFVGVVTAVGGTPAVTLYSMGVQPY